MKPTKRIDTILFGRTENATLRDYRFLLFLRLIKPCGLEGHTQRFDCRETYKLDQFSCVDHGELRMPPRRSLEEIIETTLSLGQETYFELFAPLRNGYCIEAGNVQHYYGSEHDQCAPYYLREEYTIERVKRRRGHKGHTLQLTSTKCFNHRLEVPVLVKR